MIAEINAVLREQTVVLDDFELGLQGIGELTTTIDLLGTMTYLNLNRFTPLVLAAANIDGGHGRGVIAISQEELGKLSDHLNTQLELGKPSSICWLLGESALTLLKVARAVVAGLESDEEESLRVPEIGPTYGESAQIAVNALAMKIVELRKTMAVVASSITNEVGSETKKGKDLLVSLGQAGVIHFKRFAGNIQGYNIKANAPVII